MGRAAPTRCGCGYDDDNLELLEIAASRTLGRPSRSSRRRTAQISSAMSDDEEWKSSFVQGDDAALTAAIKAREAECDPLLRRGPSADPVKALALSLADPPYATRTAAVKDAATELVCKCMASASDIDAAIGTLSLEQCDVLMKYIYRGCARAAILAAPRCASPRRPPPPALTAPSRRRRAGSASKRRSSLTTLLSSNGTRR